LEKKQQQTNKQRKDKLNCFNPLGWMQLYYHKDIFFSKQLSCHNSVKCEQIGYDHVCTNTTVSM